MVWRGAEERLAVLPPELEERRQEPVRVEAAVGAQPRRLNLRDRGDRGADE